MTIARSVVVTGRVQGVCFRAWTQRQAERLGIAGWVRNRDDGAVEAVIEGEEDAVANMLASLREGPTQARVDDLACTPVDRSGVRDFVVRR